LSSTFWCESAETLMRFMAAPPVLRGFNNVELCGLGRRGQGGSKR